MWISKTDCWHSTTLRFGRSIFLIAGAVTVLALATTPQSRCLWDWCMFKSRIFLYVAVSQLCQHKLLLGFGCCRRICLATNRNSQNRGAPGKSDCHASHSMSGDRKHCEDWDCWASKLVTPHLPEGANSPKNWHRSKDGSTVFGGGGGGFLKIDQKYKCVYLWPTLDL